MSRGRWVKPEFFKSLTITKLNMLIRLHFIGLWTYADDEGRGADVPQLIKAELWPMDDNITTRVVEECQAALEKEGLIIRYASEGRGLFQIRNWREHQSVPKSRPSGYPPPDQWKQDSSSPTVEIQEEGGASSSISSSSRAVLGSNQPLARRDEAFEALCSVSGNNWNELTPAGRGAINRALKHIRSVVSVEDDLPAEIRRRADNYRITYSHAPLTAPALAKHWASCGEAQSNSTTGRLLAAAAEMRAEEEAQDGPQFIGGGRESALGLPGPDANSEEGGG